METGRNTLLGDMKSLQGIADRSGKIGPKLDATEKLMALCPDQALHKSALDQQVSRNARPEPPVEQDAPTQCDAVCIIAENHCRHRAVCAYALQIHHHALNVTNADQDS